MTGDTISKEEIQTTLSNCEKIFAHTEYYESAQSALDKSKEVDVAPAIKSSDITDVTKMVYEAIISLIKTLPKNYPSDPNYVQYYLRESHQELLGCDKLEFITLGTCTYPKTEEELIMLSNLANNADIEILRGILQR